MDVYWSNFNANLPFLYFEEPKSLFSEIQISPCDYKLCPATRDTAKKTFMLRFPIDYDFYYDSYKQVIGTNFYDQDFFNKCVLIRSTEEKLITLDTQFLFVAEESLKLEVTGAYYTDNDFTRNTTYIPGEFDIGKWARPIDCTFHIRKDLNYVKINAGDVFAYVKFCTDEPINFVKFDITPQLHYLINSNIDLTKKFKTKQFPLSKWYDLYQQTKSKNAILKQIKNNIL